MGSLLSRFFLLEVVTVADASVHRAGPVTDVRVAVDEDGSFRPHRHAQPRSELQRRRSRFRPSHALREAGVAQQGDVCFSPAVSQVLRRVDPDFPQLLLVRRCCCLPAPSISK